MKLGLGIGHFIGELAKPVAQVLSIDVIKSKKMCGQGSTNFQENVEHDRLNNNFVELVYVH